jgi:hypothetical protein
MICWMSSSKRFPRWVRVGDEGGALGAIASRRIASRAKQQQGLFEHGPQFILLFGRGTVGPGGGPGFYGGEGPLLATVVKSGGFNADRPSFATSLIGMQPNLDEDAAALPGSGPTGEVETHVDRVGIDQFAGIGIVGPGL